MTGLRFVWEAEYRPVGVRRSQTRKLTAGN